MSHSPQVLHVIPVKQGAVCGVVTLGDELFVGSHWIIISVDVYTSSEPYVEAASKSQSLV